jgi:hypothetical protein
MMSCMMMALSQTCLFCKCPALDLLSDSIVAEIEFQLLLSLAHQLYFVIVVVVVLLSATASIELSHSPYCT